MDVSDKKRGLALQLIKKLDLYVFSRSLYT